MQSLTYWLAEHPAIVGFRWGPSHSWFSSWLFLLTSLSFYILFSTLLNLSLTSLRIRRPLPLVNHVHTLHSLLMSAISATIFMGTLFSAVAEIRDSSWAWRGRSKNTAIQWLLCFPPGTRPSGRVFFWSYAFYLSRYVHAFRGVLVVAGRRRGAMARVFAHAAAVAMAFLWLEFSQSFQVLAILTSTLAHSVSSAYRFWVGVGLPVRPVPVVLVCQIVVLGCNLVCHLGVMWLHFGGGRGGCSGIGAWVFNSLLNGALLWVFLYCYGKEGGGGSGAGDDKKEQ